MNTKEILQAIVTLGKAPKGEVEKALSDYDLTAAAKAVDPAHHAEHLMASDDIKEVWQDFHAVPTRAEINTGPSQSASGAGAEKMIRENSNLAPQTGTERDTEKFVRLLGDLVGAQKAQTEAIRSQGSLLVHLAEKLAKADDGDDDKDDKKKDDEEEASEKARAVTEALLQKADDVIGKAEVLGEKLATTTTAKTKKVIQARIDRLMKDASTYLEKARRGVLFVNDAALTDSFNDVAVKADADPVDDDKDKKDDDGDDEKKASKKSTEVTMQADGAEGDENGHTQRAESESAETAKAVLARVEKALSGMETMHGEITDIFNAMSNVSRSKVISPSALTKAQPALIDDDEKLFNRMSQKVLSQDETIMCDNLLQLRAMVKGGAKTDRDFETALKKTPDTVKEIFG